MAEVNRLEWDAYIKDSELMQSIGRIERRMGRMVDDVKKKGNDIDDVFSKMAKAATAYFSITQAQNFVRELVNVRSEFQQLEIAFGTMLGSKEKADQLTKDLIEFAAITPFGMKDAANAAKQLLAYGSSAESVKNELKMLGDVAAGTSQPIGDLVYLYGTLRTQGRAYMMDIRQFAGRGIPIYKELATVLGVAEGQVNDLVSAGKVGFAEIEKAFENMTAAGSMFGGLMEAQSKTIQGELERLGDAWDVMLNNIGRESEGSISTVIAVLSGMVENYEKVITVITGLIGTYGALRAAIMLTAAAEVYATSISKGWNAVQLLKYSTLLLLEKAQKAFNLTAMKNPYIAGAIILAGVIVTLYRLSDSLTAAEKAQKRFNEENKRASEHLEDFKNKTDELIRVIDDKTATEFQSNKAYKDLQRMYPSLLGNMSKEAFLLKETTERQKELNAARDAKGISDLADRYTVAQKEVERLSRQLDNLREAMRTSGGQGVGEAYAKMAEQLSSAKEYAKQVGDELSAQRRELEYSLMNDSEKVKYLERQKTELEKQRDTITRINTLASETNNIFNEFSVKNITMGLAEIESKLKNLSGSNDTSSKEIRSENWINERIKTLREEASAISITSAEYKKYQTEIASLQNELSRAQGKKTNRSSASKEADERQKLLDKIKDIEREFNLQMLDNDAREIESIKYKYAIFREEAEKYNKTVKKDRRIDLAGIDGIENQEIETVQARQANDKKLKQYDEDYRNYLRYEDLKKQAGEKYADEQLGQYRDLVSGIQNEINSLQGRQATEGISPIDEAYLKDLEKKLKEHNNKISNDEQNRYVEALRLAQTFNDKRLEIERKYQEARKALGENITPEHEQELQRKEAKEYSSLATDELTGTDAWARLFDDLDALTASQLDALIKEIEAKFDDLSVNFDPIDLNAVRKRLQEAKDMIIADNPFKQVGVAIKAIFEQSADDSKDSSQDIKRNWTNLAKATEASFDFVADAVNSADFLKDAIGEVGQTALMSMMSVASTAIAVAAAIKTAEKASVILAIIQAALVVVQAIANVFKSIFNAKDKRMEKSIKSKRVEVEELDRAFGQLERTMNRAAGADYYKIGQDQIKNLQQQKKLTEQMMKDEQKKKKTDKEKVQQYKSDIQDIDNQIEDVGQTLMDTLLKSTFKDLADDIASSLVSALEKGEDAIESLNKSYDDFIKNAIISSAKMLLLEPVIKEMMDNASDYAKKNGYSLEGFDFNSWRSTIEDAGGKFIDNVNQVFSGLGLSFDDSSSTQSAANKVGRVITEDTAQQALGIWYSQREYMKQIATSNHDAAMRIANDKLATLNAIEYNTAQTVVGLTNTVGRLDNVLIELQAIKTNTKGARNGG